MNIHTFYRPILRYFRKKRMMRFYSALNVTSKTKILDVGGSPFIWEIAASRGLPEIENITILNLFDVDRNLLPANVRWVVGDGCKLPFDDGEFDVVFSNSVIEHLGCHEAQVCFAKEINRVGKRFWVQTPDPKFFIEPHYLSPFIHWFPIPFRRKLIPYATTWGLMEHPSKREIDERLAEIRLIPAREFKGLFPQAEIITERWIGMPKSLVAKHG